MTELLTGRKDHSSLKVKATSVTTGCHFWTDVRVL